MALVTPVLLIAGGKNPSKKVDATPMEASSLLNAIEELEAVKSRYFQLSPVTQEGKEISGKIVLGLSKLSNSLIEIVEASKRPDIKPVAIEILEAEYLPLISRLIKALGPDYAESMLASPKLWESPSNSLQEMVSSIDSFATQVQENLRELNYGKEFEFKVTTRLLKDL